jgi:hypothetical protein
MELFHFKRAGVRTVMRMLARWYDVEVVYQGTVTIVRKEYKNSAALTIGGGRAIKVDGTVYHETGEPLSGANVIIKAQGRGQSRMRKASLNCLLQGKQSKYI